MAYKAFVSSTYEDLKAHRAYVIAMLRKAGFFVDPMEDWTASTDEPKVFSQQRVEGCDLCVLMVAFRRGYVPKNEQLSITQMEFNAATHLSIDTLVFMLDIQAPWPRHFDELNTDKELVAWRMALGESKGVGFFGLSPDTIEISSALSRWLTNKQANAEYKTAVKNSSSTVTNYDPEEELWVLVRNSDSIQDFEKFLESFSAGRFAKVAAIRLNQLVSARKERNKKISFFINSCREFGFNKEPGCEQCGNKVYIDLLPHLQKILDELDIPPRNKQVLHLNGGSECAIYKRMKTITAILPELSDDECEEMMTAFHR